MKGMRHAILAFSLAFLALTPAIAEDEPPSGYGLSIDDLNVLENFAGDLQQLFEGLADSVDPLVDDMGQMLETLNDYHAPEILPNGDIIIRRKQPLVGTEPEIGKDGEVDL